MKERDGVVNRTWTDRRRSERWKRAGSTDRLCRFSFSGPAREGVRRVLFFVLRPDSV